MLDLSTKNERKWLDRLGRCRLDMVHAGPLFVSQRRGPKDGQFLGVSRPWKRYAKRSRKRFAVYCVNLAWIKNECRRRERQMRKEREEEARNCLGAFI